MHDAAAANQRVKRATHAIMTVLETATHSVSSISISPTTRDMPAIEKSGWCQMLPPSQRQPPPATLPTPSPSLALCAYSRSVSQPATQGQHVCGPAMYDAVANFSRCFTSMLTCTNVWRSCCCCCYSQLSSQSVRSAVQLLTPRCCTYGATQTQTSRQAQPTQVQTPHSHPKQTHTGTEAHPAHTSGCAS